MMAARSVIVNYCYMKSITYIFYQIYIIWLQINKLIAYSELTFLHSAIKNALSTIK